MSVNKKFGFSHKSGLLMAVSALPSEYGIGSFGKACFDWLDFLDKTGTKCWQILPLNPTAYGDSPYQSPASFAGNPYFVDLEELYKEGLLTSDELDGEKCKSERIDYRRLFLTRIAVLKKAFSRFVKTVEYVRFCHKNKQWLDDYALFFSIKESYDYVPWSSWADEYRIYKNAIERKSDFECQTEFWRFVQFKFFTQWKKVRDYARSKGIKIIGDMPIYVAYDSVDVWSNTDEYLLDENLNPTFVAGCPPDGFSPDGQLWGNPIYDYAKMEKNDFKWWCSRIKICASLFDIVRIDHFRGFAGYYSVPYGEKTARNGHWEKGPGGKLFDAINQSVPNAKIIAEDLGFLTDDVRELIAYCGYPGMKILQFAFFDEDSEYLPRLYANKDYVVYTGSHDADCTRTWTENLVGDTLKRFKRECSHIKGLNSTYKMIKLAFESIAELAVIPLQDWLLLGNEEGRMNTPSVAQGNWVWRAQPDYASKKLISTIKRFNVRSHREK
jgi:4-alpha-glucanotransferase